MSGPRARLAEPLLLVGGLVLVGLALRLPSFDDALFGDELSSYFVSIDHGPRGLLDFVRSDQENTPPLYYLTAWAAHEIGGSAESLRLPSLLAGLAAIPLTYLLGLWTVGRRAALVGAALVSLSPFLIFYSTEARAYALVLALALASTVCLLRALDTRRLPWWAAYAAFSCAAMYAHYTAAFVLAAQLGWALVVHPGARRALLDANLVAAVVYLPWLPGLLEDRDSPTARVIGALHPFELGVIPGDLLQLSIGHPLVSEGELPGPAAIGMICAGLALGVAGLLWARRQGRAGQWRPSAGTALIMLLAAAAPALAALYSAFGASVFLPRNLIVSWPALALAAGALLTAGAGWLRVGAVGLVLAGFAVGAGKMLDADYQRPDYDAAARFVERSMEPGDPIVQAPALGSSSGPQTPLEASFGPPPVYGPPDEIEPPETPVIVLGRLPLTRQVLLLGPDSPSRLFLPPGPAPERSARRAARMAAGGSLYLVVQGADPFAALRDRPLPGLADFLRALPPWLRHVETRTFPSEHVSPVSVYVLRDVRPPGERTGRGRRAGAPEARP